MSPPRRFPYRKLDDVERLFIDTRLVLGRSPAAIRDMMNGIVGSTPERIIRGSEVPHFSGLSGRTKWTELIGRPPYTIEDIRREYDRMRKSRDPEMMSRNADRKQMLVNYGFEDSSRHAVAEIRTQMPAWPMGKTRRLADAGARYRLLEDEESKELLEDAGYTDL